MLSRWSLVRFQLSRKRSSSVAEQRNCFFKLCRRPNFMNIEDIAIALDLQNRAYALLLWTARKAPGLLETDSLAASDSCERWLARHWNVFDTEFRQSFGELKSFALMLTSFFTTSFHLEEEGERRKLVRGRKFKDKRNKKYALGRAGIDAAELSRLALEALAQEEGIPAPGEVIEVFLHNDVLAEHLSLWWYGCEMVRRSDFASQGPAVHRLWLEVEENKRKNLSAEMIWRSREQLVVALKKKAIHHEQQ
jgi:hypothetical protein